MTRMRTLFFRFLIPFSMNWSLLISLPATTRPTNVVLIMADDVGFECFSSYGSKEYSTPHLDALAKEGIRFTNCHSTPLHTQSHKPALREIQRVQLPRLGIYPKGEPTFGNYFKAMGYATAVAGKWQLLKSEAGITPPRPALILTACGIPQNKSGTLLESFLERDGKLLNLEKDTHGPDVVTDFLIEFIEKNKDRPFLAYYPMILVHSPFPPTPQSKDLEEKENKKNFVDMVNYMDQCAGRITDKLEELGLRENTLFIFTSDNGTHDSLTSVLQDDPVSGGKGFTHDYGTHVPLIVNQPGIIPTQQVNDDLICFSDFFPTLIEAAALPARPIKDGDGWSFWPQCLGQMGTKREWLYGYYFPRPYSGKFDNKYAHWEVHYARDKQHKLYADGDLYDVQIDPLEKSPITTASENSVQAKARKKLLSALEAYPKEGRAVDRSRVKAKRPANYRNRAGN